MPYQVRSWVHKGDHHGELGLVGVGDISSAKQLQHLRLFVAAEVLEVAQRSGPFAYIGYEVIDREQGVLGRVDHIVVRPLQPLLQVCYQGKTLLLPLHHTFIKAIDRENQRLTTHLPADYLVDFVS